MKVQFDTSAIINLLKPDNGKRHDDFVGLVNQGQIEFVINHAVFDDGFGPNRVKIGHIRTTLVSNGSSPYGMTKYGQSRYGDPDGVCRKLIQGTLSTRPNSRRDAIHYATAHLGQVDYFVTDDKKLARRIKDRIEKPVKVVSLDEFFTIIESAAWNQKTPKAPPTG